MDTIFAGRLFTSLHDFTGGTDGGRPFSNVILDAAGNLYGTTLNGGGTPRGYGGGGLRDYAISEILAAQIQLLTNY